MKSKLDARNVSQDVLFVLIDYFNSHTSNISSYDELTDSDKNFISEDVWNKMRY